MSDMEWITNFLDHLWDLSLDAGPWLLLGMLAAGLIRAFVPDGLMRRWIGGRGLGSVVRAAMIGAPLPLCSCGVIPAAVGLRRQGASKGSTVSFLVATPETGVDSVAVTYALMGPFMAVVRPIAAVASAIVAGLSTSWFAGGEAEPASGGAGGVRGADAAGGDCCGTSGCCGSEGAGGLGGGDAKVAAAARAPWRQRLSEGMRFAVTDLIDDLAWWLLVGLLLAAAVMTFIPPAALAGVGGGLAAMLVMLVVGIPMYICATASTPLAASLLLAGVSPGAVLVFMLAGPATNIATLGIVRRELGGRALGTYLLGVGGTALVAGLATDWLARRWTIVVADQVEHAGHVVPHWLAVASVVVLVVVAIKPLRRALGGLAVRRPTPAVDSAPDATA